MSAQPGGDDFQIVTRISRTPRVRVNPPGSHRPVGGRLERDDGKVSVGREEIGDFGLDLAMAFATPEGDIGIAMTLAPDARERLDQMHVLKMFMAWKMALGFIMTTELHEPDAILPAGVNRKETLAVMSTISRKPLRFGEPEWLSPDAVSDEVLQLLPRGACAISESQTAEIGRFFGSTGLFPAVKIG
jgi:hypothetical protein